MRFDTATLMAAASIITALGGVLLLAVWLQMRHATALLWWSAANFLSAAGIALLAAGLLNTVAPLLAAGTLLADAAPPLVWIGARTFNQRHTPKAAAFAGIAVWLVVDQASALVLAVPLTTFAGWAIWLSLAGIELWRGRAEKIPARWALIAILAVHASIYAGGVYDVLAGNFPASGLPPLNSWFGIIFFEGLTYAMGSAISMVLICRERETQKYMHAAHNDSLTGIANHGSFLDGARRLFMRCKADGAPCSLIMFDLDHFKNVNDVYGHRVGDQVLRAFADTARGLLRANDLFGRYGGEEFTAVLPNATIETAYVIAERVRHTFADAHRFWDGQPLNATVSAGVAEAGPEASFDATIDAADQALYRAKKLGRDRVQRAGRDGPTDDDHNNVIRVA
jgi:diguanylate cyclase (GGDEF)-like protein